MNVTSKYVLSSYTIPEELECLSALYYYQNVAVDMLVKFALFEWLLLPAM